MRSTFAFRLLEKGVLTPSEKLAKPIFPTPAWRVKSPLIRRFGEETAMGTYLTYARHRSFSPKPPSERPFDAHRQKLALLASKTIKKGALPLSAIGEANSPIPKSKGIGWGFRILCFFILLQKARSYFCCNFKTAIPKQV